MTAGIGDGSGRSWLSRLVRSARLRTVRTRVTVVAGLALTAAVLLGLAVMYLIQAGSTDRTIQSQLRTYAAQIAQSAGGGSFPRPLPGSTIDTAAQAQVVAPDGTVLTATRGLAGRPALYTLAPGASAPARQAAGGSAGDGDQAVFGEHVTVAGRRVAIITSTTATWRSQVSETFSRLLTFGVPGLLVLACATIWLVVGRSLRPVERIRATAGAITHADLSQRVPDPGTDDEIGHLARTMNDMLTRLDEAAARQRRFVADASHELRTPLTAIRTGLEVGLAHADSAPWPDIADRAVRQAERLERLIAQLLSLARSDAHQTVGQRQPADLTAMLAEICAAASAAGVRVDFDVPPGTVTAGNPDELSRMFRNLIDNAVRYARRRVRVTARTTGTAVVAEITDDGPGIPADQRHRVFDRFVRLDASREHASGSAGLGLAIAKEIATAHGATITLTEAPGGGTRAVVTLPPAGRPVSAGRAARDS